MTHPIVEAVERSLSGLAADPRLRRNLAEEIVAEVLRLAREPSEGALFKIHNAQPVPPMRATVEHYRAAWRAGIDALRREVEER